MTAPTEQVPSSVDADAPDAGAEATDPTVAAREPTDDRSHHTPAHRRPHQRWWRFGFPALLVVLALAIPTLLVVGARVVLDSNDGKIVKTITDPAAPGWEASVEPTPVLGLALVNELGQLDSVALLALTGEGGGSVVTIPSSTVMGVPNVGNVPLSIVYGTGGIDVLRQGLEGILGIGVADIEVVEPNEWTDLVGPVGPLQVTNPDQVVTSAGGDTEVLFDKGEITLPASQVWPYLSTRNPLETDLNRMVRQDAFWQAWVEQVGAAPDQTNVVPGETESGLGRFVRALGAGPLDATSLPLQPIPLDEGQEPVYEPQITAVDELVARIAAVPGRAEGARAHMAVLDGTGSLDHGMAAAVLFASIGGQIDKVGNAPEFGVETTQFVYFDDAALTRVERMRDALGVGEVVKSDELNSAVDIVVVLGADALAVDTGMSVPDASLAPTGAGGVTDDLRTVVLAATAAETKTDDEVAVLEVGEVLAITNWFVIASGRNPRQVKTIAEEVERVVADDDGPRPQRVEGLDTLQWVLLDYGEFVVHVFHEESRRFYDLERLWGDVPRVAWREVAQRP